MQTFTGWQYLLIDAANAFGMDKELFETRIQWVEANLTTLESLVDQADSKPLFYKAILAIRKAQAGQPTGHLVGFDACCSGIQIMSALTGCIAGATATGLIDPTKRADAYGKLKDVMDETLAIDHPIALADGVVVSRGQAKEALMTAFYGSKAKPKEIFGEDTPELKAFYKAAYAIAPGAWELLQDLLASWRPYALMHQWKLPDGFDARVKVMVKKEARIEVDELDHATFTYEFYENEGTKSGLSNVANVVHSVDAYVLRTIQRRCNYDEQIVLRALGAINEVLHTCHLYGVQTNGTNHKISPDSKLPYYVEQYDRSEMADVVILPYIQTKEDAECLEVPHLEQLREIILTMLVHKPFPVITVHDEFRCHANNVNALRQHYINVFAEIAESRLLSDLMSQLYNTACPVVKICPNLGSLIRGGNYALS